jgi:Fatty acid cis/trans isomerase (CTI)
LSQGVPGPPAPPPLPSDLAAQVRTFETFLNGTSNKERLTARYLYEHLFLAHLYFEGDVSHYFEMVRSRTPPGSPIDVIATVRPYDDPGADPFYYRVRPFRGTILHKTHLVYSLGPKRLTRWRELFLESSWDVATLPSYEGQVAANPFLSFAAIPARARYQFLLDDAEYTIMTFIRGPVCRGQIAVDVIEDRFWVAFLDPDFDLSVTDPTYLPAAAPDLVLPAEDASDFKPGDLWAKEWKFRRRYVRFRDERYGASDPQGRGLPLAAIWDGDGHNPNALLTVFRHFDNAEVVRGYVGAVPKTAWIVDYPLLERIYYDLVAGFNVFGGVAHQVSTRLYMDYLRMESEDLFLSFLPKDVRRPLRESWYRGLLAHLTLFVSDRDPGWERGTQVVFRTNDPKGELLMTLLERGNGLWPMTDSLNRCSTPPCEPSTASPAQRQIETQLQKIASVKGEFVRYLPELSLLRVHDGREDGLIYTIIHDRAHKNVAFMFREQSRLLPEDDTLTIVPEYFGSYPNFFFEATPAEMPDFVTDLRAVDSEEAFLRYVARWGVRRSSPRFWATSDWFQSDFASHQPLRAGLLDLNRYLDP